MAKMMTGNEPVEVKWDNEPLDVSLERHGNKKPDRKVKVRGILRDEWLEREAEEADGLRDAECDCEEEDAEVSPDQMITCPKCHKRFRVGKKQ